MGEIRMTRDFFLWCMSVIYLFAFGSLFVQIPGLYGDKGILPAKYVIQEEAQSMQDLLANQPTLLRLLPRIGLDVVSGMDFLCLGGVILAFAAMVSRRLRNSFVFFLLWLFYLSVFQVGQTFLWFQWDILLLEAGFLTILVAPLNLLWWRGVSHHIHDKVTLWLIKWLLFRLMFASGVVKLTSLCPTWWGLTALNYHYETQCIPTGAAWFFQQLPEWFQKLSVVITYIIEIAIPFLFFSPVRSQRIFAFYAQVLLQVLIILTGNYNFFNLLTITLCIALLDDNFLRRSMGKTPIGDDEEPQSMPLVGRFWRLIRLALNLFVYGSMVYFTVKLFTLRLKFKPSFSIDSKIAFDANDLTRFLQWSVPISIWMGVLSLGWELLKALLRALLKERGILRKLLSTSGVVILGTLAILMFSISLATLTKLEKRGNIHLPSKVTTLYRATKSLKLTSSYGLFRRMTGVGGRPEVIIEGSNHMDHGWMEYNFLYKPGNITERPPIVAPHQPRLDWQMWFAALGNYQRNPWFLNLCYRLLTAQPEVLQLIGKNPFPDAPPKYIRASLYHYHFTRMDKQHECYHATDWWTRKRIREYLPILTKNEPTFVNYLTKSGILLEENPAASEKVNLLRHCLTVLRSLIGQPEGFLFIVALFITALVLTFFDPSVRLIEWPDS